MYRLPGHSPSVVAIGDLNHDGRPDIAIGEHLCGTDCHLIVLLQASNGTLAAPVLYASREATSIVIADFNGDDRNDVAIAYGTDCGLAIYYQQPNGTLGAPVDITPPRCAYDLATADLTNSGRADLIAMPWGSNTSDLYLYLQDSNGVLTRHDSSISGGGYDNVGAADLNSDGFQDVFVVSPQAPPRIAFRPGVGQGQLGPQQLISSPWPTPWSVAAGDLNNDGKIDFAIGGSGILFQGNSGTFAPFLLPVLLPEHLVIADLDRNGLDDIIGGPVNMGGVREGIEVWLQQPSGGFRLEQYMLPNVPSNYSYNKFIAVADVNGDGKLDVVVPLDGGALAIFYGSLGRRRAARH